MRISKNDGTQKLDLQKDALIQAGVDPERIYFDQTSGKNDRRNGLDSCLKALQPGNILAIWQLDRLGRDLRHLIEIVEDLNKKNIGIKVLSGAGSQLDTTTANGKLFFGFFAVLADFERELIIERTKAGLVAARARGRKGGRPRKMDRTNLKMAMTAMSDPKACAKDVAKRLGITTTTLYMYVNSDGTLKSPGERLLPVGSNAK